jgi:hypothetical protein
MLVLVSLFFAAVFGWIANLFKIFGTSFEPLTAIAVMRIVGIFVAPLGSVLGFV